MDLTIRLLNKEDDKSSFDSANYELNHFFQKYASQNQFKHYIGSTYVAMLSNIIVGFITISASSIKVEEYKNKDIKKLPKYPLPILRVSRFAVDIRYQNKGIGKALLTFVLRLGVEQKHKFGCIGVVVDAKTESEAYYEQFGFENIDVIDGRIDTRPYTKTMYLSMHTILKVTKK